MPVRKFRSVEEMKGPAALPPLAPDNLRAALSLTEIAYNMRPWRFPPGLYKFRSLEEANRHRTKWEAEMIRAGRTRE